MPQVKVKVIITGQTEDDEEWSVEDTTFGVPLTEDSVSMEAANMGHGLVEEAWGKVPKDD